LGIRLCRVIVQAPSSILMTFFACLLDTLRFMRKEDYQDVMWLFHELGECLRSKRQNAPKDWDTRALFRDVVENHQSTFFGGRNPFNWLKELQTTLNFWFHLQIASDVPEDDVWRDLDTLERVAGYLGLDSAFVDSVHNVKNRIPARTSTNRGPKHRTSSNGRPKNRTSTNRGPKRASRTGRRR